MSDTEFGCSGSTSCSPSDCASCAGGCGGSDISSHRTITLTMEDDTEVECAILTIFPVDAKEPAKNGASFNGGVKENGVKF